MAEDKIFADGLLFKAPRENAPDFVKGSLSVKVGEFIAFLQKHETNSGWINIDIKESKGGKLYCELNTYKPERPSSVKEPEEAVVDHPEEDFDPNDIPF